MKINYKSDFDFLLRTVDSSGAEMEWPLHDWRARFYTSNRGRYFEASCFDGVCRNCIKEDGKIRIVADGHGLGPGRLWCELDLFIPDDTYPDGIRHEVTPVPLDIDLVAGASDKVPVIGTVPLPGGELPDISAILDELASMRETVTALEKRLEFVGDGGGDYLPAGPPQVIIDTWNIACGTLGKFNATSGFFELNGLIDLTYEDAIKILSYGRHWSFQHFAINPQTEKSKIRTCLPPQAYSTGTLDTFNQLFYGQSDIEVINLNPFSTNLNFSYGVSTKEPYAEKVFNKCSKLHTIYGYISVANMSVINDWFNGCFLLRELRLFGVNKDLNFKDCPLLSPDSLSYIVSKRYSTNKITFTVHADVYAKLTGDTTNEVTAALSTSELEKWCAIMTLADEKNITFVTL